MGGMCGSSTIKSSSPQTRWRTASLVPLVVVEEEKEENSGGGAQYSTCERQQLLCRKREAARALGGANGQHALTPTQQIRCERASERATARPDTSSADTTDTRRDEMTATHGGVRERVCLCFYSSPFFKKYLFIFFGQSRKTNKVFEQTYPTLCLRMTITASGEGLSIIRRRKISSNEVRRRNTSFRRRPGSQ